MSLVHDLAECVVGDLAPADNVSKDDKKCREKVR
jgi:putative hydrolase of HD superfamily